MANKHESWELKQMQSLPLPAKIQMTRQRVRSWVDEFGEDSVYISFSGGKDSTVLLDIVRKDYPYIKAIFIDTGLEYPQIRDFVKRIDNVEVIRPKMNFREVLIRYGYPILSKELALKAHRIRTNENSAYLKFFNGTEKGSIYDLSRYKWVLNAPFKISHMCCDVMKKTPAHDYERKTRRTPITAQMAEESRLRLQKWIKHGCNAWDLERPQSNPMSFWTENDVLEYIYLNNIKIAEPYGKVIKDVESEFENQLDLSDFLGDYRGCKFCTTGCKRTGCIFCLFGIRQDKERITRLQIQEPKLADYVLRGGEFGDNGYWQPSNNGLGYWFIIDWLNLHGLGITYYKDIDYAGIYGNERTRKILLSEKIKARMKRMEVSDDRND